MAQNIMDKQKKWLLRQFHTLCGRLHLSAEEKAAIIEGYGVESSADTLPGTRGTPGQGRAEDGPPAQAGHRRHRRMAANAG